MAEIGHDDYRTVRLARVLRATARLTAAEADLIGRSELLRELCAELAGVLDIRDGLAVTNPETRLNAHLARIDELVATVPPLDGGAR